MFKVGDRVEIIPYSTSKDHSKGTITGFRKNIPLVRFDDCNYCKNNNSNGITIPPENLKLIGTPKYNASNKDGLEYAELIVRREIDKLLPYTDSYELLAQAANNIHKFIRSA